MAWQPIVSGEMNDYPKRLPIILLDLNYTLVGNSDDPTNKIPYPGRIVKQVYRTWLIDMIRDYQVFLITARDARFAEATLADIKRKTGWQPDRSYWNEFREQPPVCKLRILNTHLFPEFGRGEIKDLPVEHPPGDSLFPNQTARRFVSPFIAIESNPRTRLMYHKNKIPAFPCQDLQSGKCALTRNEHPERLDIQER